MTAHCRWRSSSAGRPGSRCRRPARRRCAPRWPRRARTRAGGVLRAAVGPGRWARPGGPADRRGDGPGDDVRRGTAASSTAISWHGLLRGARAAGSDTIRVWSAGCATGEEAYTLALLAAEAFAPGPPPVDVLGTDISCAALAAAAAGRYRERAVGALDARAAPALPGAAGGRQLPGGPPPARRWSASAGTTSPATRSPRPGEAGFDLIVCRNVLIYFEAPSR